MSLFIKIMNSKDFSENYRKQAKSTQCLIKQILDGVEKFIQSQPIAEAATELHRKAERPTDIATDEELLSIQEIAKFIDTNKQHVPFNQWNKCLKDSVIATIRHFARVYAEREAELDKWKAAEREIGHSYLRIRAMLIGYGSMDTKPGGEDRFEKTEEAICKLIELVEVRQPDPVDIEARAKELARLYWSSNLKDFPDVLKDFDLNFIRTRLGWLAVATHTSQWTGMGLKLPTRDREELAEMVYGKMDLSNQVAWKTVKDTYPRTAAEIYRITDLFLSRCPTNQQAGEGEKPCSTTSSR